MTYDTSQTFMVTSAQSCPADPSMLAWFGCQSYESSGAWTCADPTRTIWSFITTTDFHTGSQCIALPPARMRPVASSPAHGPDVLLCVFLLGPRAVRLRAREWRRAMDHPALRSGEWPSRGPTHPHGADSTGGGRRRPSPTGSISRRPSICLRWSRARARHWGSGFPRPTPTRHSFVMSMSFASCRWIAALLHTCTICRAGGRSPLWTRRDNRTRSATIRRTGLTLRWRPTTASMRWTRGAIPGR